MDDTETWDWDFTFLLDENVADEDDGDLVVVVVVLVVMTMVMMMMMIRVDNWSTVRRGIGISQTIGCENCENAPQSERCALIWRFGQDLE